MNKYYGVWLDHARAHVVEIDALGGMHGETIESDVEGHHRSFGQSGVSPPGHVGGNPESHYEHRRAEELKRYYREVIRRIEDGTQILVMGPGEAKYELERELRRRPELLAHVVGFETADRLSFEQIAARTRGVLHEHSV